LDIAYYIAFGAHGPRAQSPKGEGWRIFGKVVQLTAASVAIFYAVHAFAGKQPATMSKEWQEASNEYALVISPLSNPPFRPSRDISWKF
jgi:cytochrome c oxidase subunit 4